MKIGNTYFFKKNIVFKNNEAQIYELFYEKNKNNTRCSIEDLLQAQIVKILRITRLVQNYVLLIKKYISWSHVLININVCLCIKKDINKWNISRVYNKIKAWTHICTQMVFQANAGPTGSVNQCSKFLFKGWKNYVDLTDSEIIDSK